MLLNKLFILFAAVAATSFAEEPSGVEASTEGDGVSISVVASKGARDLFKWENPLADLLFHGSLPPACKTCHIGHPVDPEPSPTLKNFFAEMIKAPLKSSKRELASVVPSPEVQVTKGVNCGVCVWGDDKPMWQECDTPERKKSRVACETGWEQTGNPSRCVWKNTGNRCIPETKDQCYQFATSVRYPPSLFRVLSKAQFLTPGISSAVFGRFRENGCTGQVTLTLMEQSHTAEDLLRYLGVLATHMPESQRLFVDGWGCSTHRNLEDALRKYQKASDPVVAKALKGRTALISANQGHTISAPGRYDLLSSSQSRATFEIHGLSDSEWKADLRRTGWCKHVLSADDIPRWCSSVEANHTIDCHTGFKNHKELRAKNTCCPRPADNVSIQLPESLRYLFVAGTSCKED